MTGGQVSCVAEQVVGDLVFVCLVWCSYFCWFCCVWTSCNLFDPTTLRGELGGGCNKGIGGTLAVGRLPNTHEDMSVF